jgi:hypothetical protein
MAQANFDSTTIQAVADALSAGNVDDVMAAALQEPSVLDRQLISKRSALKFAINAMIVAAAAVTA